MIHGLGYLSPQNCSLVRNIKIVPTFSGALLPKHSYCPFLFYFPCITYCPTDSIFYNFFYPTPVKYNYILFSVCSRSLPFPTVSRSVLGTKWLSNKYLRNKWIFRVLHEMYEEHVSTNIFNTIFVYVVQIFPSSSVFFFNL